MIDLPVEIRNDVARLEIAGERSAGAVQLLDKRWRRRTVGVVSGSAADRSQPLIGATYYLSRALNPFADIRLAEGVAPAEAVDAFPRSASADADPRRCRQRRRGARAARQMDRQWRRAGALCRPASRRRHRRRPGAGEAAPRRPHPRRQPELGKAAAARRFFARRPVRRHAGAERRHRHPPGAGRARCAAHRPHLGDARRRHAAGHRPAPRQGPAGAVPRDRRHALVGPAAVGHLRRHAPAHRRAGRTRPRAADSRRAPARPAAASGHANQAVPATRVLDGFGAFSVPPPTARPVPANFNARANADHPPGFYGPPEGLVAVNTLAPERPAGAARFFAAQRPPRRLPPWRAARPARPGLPRRAWRC